MKGSRNTPLKTLLNTLPQQGRLEWIGLRPARREAMSTPASAELSAETGIVGDRYAGRSGSRHVTLIQAEHLGVIQSISGFRELDAAMLRRNLVVSGLNLLALKGKQFIVGEAELEYTGACHPCSRMEELLGPGGYNAVRGHGGITARVVGSGRVAIDDIVKMSRLIE